MTPHGPALRVSYVEGVTPAKWLRVWNERHPDRELRAERVAEAAQLDRLDSGEADMAFVRLPVSRDGVHAIPLYDEAIVVALMAEHPLADAHAESVVQADLDDLERVPDEHGPRMTLELVAAGTGIAVLPQSVARLFARKDVTTRFVTDAPGTTIALIWPIGGEDSDDASGRALDAAPDAALGSGARRIQSDIDEFIGVVRGRTTRSSRGVASVPPASDAAAAQTPESPGTARAKAQRKATKRDEMAERNATQRAQRRGHMKPGRRRRR